MTVKRSRRGLQAVLLLVMVAGVLAILRPWTIVPIQSTTVRTFDSDGYVTSIWETRVVPTAQRSAIELRTFMESQAGARPEGARPTRAVFVRGTATVADVDRKSRIGLARLRLPWAPDAHAAAIQIGPVLRGTALRDALEFIRFTDFVNQLEFAGVANALNDRIVKGVLTAVNADTLAGREVTFVGAVPTTRTSSTLEIVPVHLQVVGDAR
jgi:predicted lipoprotein